MKKYLPIFAICILAVFMRFAYLDKIPNAVSGDELHYVNTAKAVFLTGRDLTGTWSPWSLLWFRYPPNEHQAELPYLLHLASSARYPFSLFLIKLPFALLSVGVVLLLFAVTLELFGRKAAIATGALAAINPWFIIMGRAGYEATPAMFFYLLSLWVILKTKKWQVLWTIIPLLLAFYSYIATKVLFVPFVITISCLAYIKNGKKFAQPYMLLTALSFIVAIGFFVLTKTDPTGSRLDELFSPNSSIVANEVNAMRATTIASPLMTIIINKYTVYMEVILHKIIRIFSPSYLFVEGDQFFLPVRLGFFYYLDAVFLFLGAIFFARKHRLYAWMMLVFIVISIIPQLVSTTMGDFSIHLTMFFPFLLIVMGAGAAWVIRKPWTVLLCIVIYAVLVAGFIVTYFYRAPLTGYADFPKRILTRYLVLAAAKNIPVTVHASSTGDTFQKYLFYSDAMTKETIPAIARALTSPSIQFGGITFVSCGSPEQPQETVIDDTLCGKPASEHHNSIATLTDGGETYIIYEDKLCNTYQLKRYPEHIKINDFAVEQLSEQQFCETYLSQR